MNPLREHVERLFSAYKPTREIQELKEEVFGNLEAKAADLIAGGMETEEAVRRAIAGLDNIDYLIEDNKRIYINKFRLELAQLVLQAVLVFWILSMPLLLLGPSRLNLLLLAAVCVAGLLYVLQSFRMKGDTVERVETRNYRSACRTAKWIWLLWGLYMVISLLSVTGIHFGSNIWYGRPVRVEGPYQWAAVAAGYAKPLAFLWIPLMAARIPKLMLKNEAGGDV